MEDNKNKILNHEHVEKHVNKIGRAKRLAFSWLMTKLASQKSTGTFIKLVTYRNDKDNLARDIKLGYLPTNWEDKITVQKAGSIKTEGKTLINYYIITKKHYPISFNEKYILFCHGLTSTKVASYKHALKFVELGYNIVTFSQRGYGESHSKKYTTFSDKESKDVLKIVKDLRLKQKVLKLALMGESMGAATVLQYAKKYSSLNLVDSFIADSPFSSLEDITKFWIKKVYHKGDEKINNMKNIVNQKGTTYFKRISFIQNIDSWDFPLMLIHSYSDKVIPYTMTQELYKSRVAHSEKTLLLLTHNKPHITSFEYEKYYSLVSDFIEGHKINGFIEEKLK